MGISQLTGSYIVTVENEPSLVTCPFELEVSAAATDLVFTAYHGNSGPGNMAGAGSGNNPFAVTNTAQLQAISDNLTANYVLCDNIAAGATTTFEPIGAASSVGFVGLFDGLGFEIQELHIAHPTTGIVGLFARIDVAGTVRNVGLMNGSTVGEFTVGAIAGENLGTLHNVANSGEVRATDSQEDAGVGGLVGINHGTITLALNSGTVTGQSDVGGAVGTNFGVLTEVFNAGGVTGEEYVGGIAGYSRDADLSELLNSGAVIGDVNVGGLVGDLGDSNLSESINMGKVTGVNNQGGLVGSLSGAHISNSHNTGELVGHSYIGGIAGVVDSSSTIVSSHNSGTITGKGSEIGGVAGTNNGTIEYSSNRSPVTSTGTNDPDDYGVGGIVGWNNALAEIHGSFNLENIAIPYRTEAGGIAGGNDGLITTSYNWGNVVATDLAGGITGYNSGEIRNTYSSGEVTATTDHGGIAGFQEVGGDMISSYFDEDKALNNYPAFGQNKTDAELKSQATFVGWNFGTVWVNEDGDYPNLIDNER